MKKFLYLVWIVLCTACATATVTPAPTATISAEQLDEELRNRISAEEQLWTGLNIDHYQIEVLHEGAWNPSFIFFINIKDGHVARYTSWCDPAGWDNRLQCLPNPRRFQPQGYTIPMLFERLRRPDMENMVNMNYPSEYPEGWRESISIEFDPRYHFPRKIIYDETFRTDERYEITVLTFRILK